MKKRLTILIAIMTLLFGTFSVQEGFGATVTPSMSGGSCTVGQNVTVTLSYRGSSLFAATATLNYDSSALTLQSVGGNVTSQNGNSFLLETSTLGATSMSATFTFATKKTGNFSVSATTTEGMTYDEESFSCGTVSATVKVNAVPSSSGSSGGSSSSSSSSSGSSSHTQSSGTNGRGDFNSSSVVEETEPEEEVDPSEKPEQIEVTIGDKTYVIVEDLTDKEFPEGFAAEDAGYGEYDWPIQIAKSEASQYTLILLMDPETEEESWFFYDEETGAITSSKSITVAEALEYEKLAAEADEPEDNTLTIALGVAAGVFALAFAVLGGYNIYTRRKSKDIFE